MDLTALNNAFRSLATNANLRAIVVDGPWGAGKTYFAKQFADDNAQIFEDAKLRFAYVSLFGVQSLAEVRSRLCMSFNSDKGWKSAAAVFKLPKQVMGVDVSGLGDFAKNYVEDKVLRKLYVCIDDLERAGPNLTVGDVLGLVSELIQDRESKCVLLLNSEAMGDAQTLKKYSEKIFDLELAFNPRPAEVISHGLPDAATARAALPVFERDACSNIRVMQRTHWALGEIAALRSELTKPLWPRIVNQVATLCLCHYRHRTVFGGSLEPMRKWSQMGYLVAKNISSRNDHKIDGQEWKEVLIKLEYDMEPYDGAVITMLQTGVLDRDAMLAGLERATAAMKKAAISEEYSALWNALRDNFAVTAEELHAMVAKFLEKSGTVLDNNECLSSCELLLELRNDKSARQLAKKLVTPIIEQFSPTARTNMLATFKMLGKSGVVAGIPYRPAKKHQTIDELFDGLTSRDNFHTENFAEFSPFTSKEIVECLLRFRGDHLLGRINTFFERLDIAPVEMRYSLQETMNSALDTLAKRNLAHKIRIDSFVRTANRQKQTPPAAPQG